MKCSNCNETIKDSSALYCHNCGYALNQKKNASVFIETAKKLWGLCRNNAKITLLIIVCAAVGIGAAVSIKSCVRKEYIYLAPHKYAAIADEGHSTPNEYAAAVKESSETTNEYTSATTENTMPPDGHANSYGGYLKLNEYMVTAKGGYGAYMREGPGTDYEIISVVRNGDYFKGAQTSVANWIVIVEDNYIVGYIHHDNVTEK